MGSRPQHAGLEETVATRRKAGASVGMSALPAVLGGWPTVALGPGELKPKGIVPAARADLLHEAFTDYALHHRHTVVSSGFEWRRGQRWRISPRVSGPQENRENWVYCWLFYKN
jgi:hypothetical protein